jgi:hypothetical protein
METRSGNPKAGQVERLLYLCAGFAVFTGIFEWAEGRYLRALLGAAVFLLVIPWLGKKWINRSGG